MLQSCLGRLESLWGSTVSPRRCDCTLSHTPLQFPISPQFGPIPLFLLHTHPPIVISTSIFPCSSIMCVIIPPSGSPALCCSDLFHTNFCWWESHSLPSAFLWRIPQTEHPFSTTSTVFLNYSMVGARNSVTTVDKHLGWHSDSSPPPRYVLPLVVKKPSKLTL